MSQVSSALIKLSTRERFLNSQCMHLTTEYRDAKERMSELQMQLAQKQDAAADLDYQLTQVMKASDLPHALSIHKHLSVIAMLISLINTYVPAKPCCTDCQTSNVFSFMNSKMPC